MVYLDDGLGIEDDYHTAVQHSDIVFQDLMESGFVPQMKKCTWTPSQYSKWLGINIDLVLGSLTIPQSKIDKVLLSITAVLLHPRVSARQLAQLVGRIGSMHLIIGNVSCLMLKFCHIRIASAPAWDFYFNLQKEEINELIFWKHHLVKLNSR